MAMQDLIVLALSNCATMILTAWVLHRSRTGQSPIPQLLARVEAPPPPDSDDFADAMSMPRGRPLCTFPRPQEKDEL